MILEYHDVILEYHDVILEYHDVILEYHDVILEYHDVIWRLVTSLKLFLNLKPRKYFIRTPEIFYKNPGNTLLEPKKYFIRSPEILYKTVTGTGVQPANHGKKPAPSPTYRNDRGQ